MKKELRGVLVNVWDSSVEVTHLEDDLHEFYKALDCSTIDIVDRFIGHLPVSIVCDDEALLVAPSRVSALDEKGKPALFGSLFITGKCVDGELTSLSREQAAEVMRASIYAFYPDGNVVPCIRDVSYERR